MANDDIIDESESEDITETEVKINNSVLNEVLPSPYMNGFYVDSVERDYRVVVWE